LIQSKERVRNYSAITNHVIPAQAGNQSSLVFWVPACAGMTEIPTLTEQG
jgi:hypothetical protein